MFTLVDRVLFFGIYCKRAVIFLLEKLNEALGGILMPAILIIIGTFFAARLGFFYVFHPIKTVKTILSNSKGGFKSLTVALAGTPGVGNIAGVSSAIIMGGAGAVFWMWISAFAAMSLKYVEVFLSIKYRREKSGEYYGGAPYYIRDGMKNKIGARFSLYLSCIFALLCVLNSLTTGNLVQINAVANVTPLPPIIFGIIFTVTVFLIISGGVKRISSFTFILMPLLTVFYIVLSLYVIIYDAQKIPDTLALIFKSAFSFRSAASGVFGYGIKEAIRYGVSRGVLSNEAGCGTAPTAHASSNTGSAHAQGCLGILEVFTDTIVLCTLTALVILIAGENPSGDAVSLVSASYGKYLGKFGVYAISGSSVLFALATVACQFYYGEEALSYITKSKLSKGIYTAVFFFVCIVSSVVPMSLMWQISDLTLSIMTVFNVICLLFLFGDLKKIHTYDTIMC